MSALAHKLPAMTLNQDLSQALARFCTAPVPGDLSELSLELEHKVECLREKFAEAYMGPDLRVVDELAKRARLLISRYPELPEAQRIMASGAVRYFIASRDVIPDGKPLMGLDDDTAVMNHVLQECGLGDFVIR